MAKKKKYNNPSKKKRTYQHLHGTKALEAVSDQRERTGSEAQKPRKNKTAQEQGKEGRDEEEEAPTKTRELFKYSVGAYYRH